MRKLGFKLRKSLKVTLCLYVIEHRFELEPVSQVYVPEPWYLTPHICQGVTNLFSATLFAPNAPTICKFSLLWLSGFSLIPSYELANGDKISMCDEVGRDFALSNGQNHFSSCPRIWKLSAPDSNLCHAKSKIAPLGPVPYLLPHVFQFAVHWQQVHVNQEEMIWKGE